MRVGEGALGTGQGQVTGLAFSPREGTEAGKQVGTLGSAWSQSLPGLPSPSWEVSSGFQRLCSQAPRSGSPGPGPVPRQRARRAWRPPTKSSSRLSQLPTQTPLPHSLILSSPCFPRQHCRSPVLVMPTCVCLLPPPTPEAWHLSTGTPLRRPLARAQDLCPQIP